MNPTGPIIIETTGSNMYGAKKSNGRKNKPKTNRIRNERNRIPTILHQLPFTNFELVLSACAGETLCKAAAGELKSHATMKKIASGMHIMVTDRNSTAKKSRS